MYGLFAILASAFTAVNAQGFAGSEATLNMPWQSCSGKGRCSSTAGKVTMDANWRWLHIQGKNDGTGNCYKANNWLNCKSDADCKSQCVLEGLSSNDYQKNYGVRANNGNLTLAFVTETQNGNEKNVNVGSRLYMLDTAGQKYQLFTLDDKEFSFDVDFSNNFRCGLNAALYFVAMDANGGGRPRYGTGYCDGQCPRDLKFIQGQV